MKRIYQGRVSKVEICKTGANGKLEEDWEELQNWEEVLWEHHVLFQDAVNYYVIALLALSTDPDSHAYKTLNQISSKDENGDQSSDGVWERFRRKGEWRIGMRESVGKYLCPNKKEPTLKNCLKAALNGNTTEPEILNLALQELLEICEGDSAIQKKGREMLPRFCRKSYNGSFPKSRASLDRIQNEKKLRETLCLLQSNEEIREFAMEVELSWVVNLAQGKEPHVGEQSRKRLIKSVEHFLQVFGGNAKTKMGDKVFTFLKESKCAEEMLQDIKSKIKALDSAQFPVIHRNVSSNVDRSEGLLLFKYFPSEFTKGLLEISFPPEEQGKTEDSIEDPFLRFGDDPILLARQERGYVFPGFTSTSEDAGEMNWIEFDIHAFKEALKALHQVDQKTEERDKQRKVLEYRLACMENRAKWKHKGEEEVEGPPILRGDPRVERLEAILKTELAEEYEATEGQSTAYGLQPRTIRGFHELREKWNKTKSDGDALLKLLRDYQTANPELVGSIRLYEELLKEENWIIWQIPSEETISQWRQDSNIPKDAHFADDPLQALTEKNLLERDIERLKEPIRFTPADPVFSRRQFYFSDVCKFTHRGEFKHVPNRLAVIVPVAMKTGETIERKTIRISYSAPRLLRDQLRSNENEKLSQAPFLQPMMEGLGLEFELHQKKMETHAVSLMPEMQCDGEKRFLLNFPIELDTEKLQGALGKSEIWDKQFANYNKKRFYLHWPETIKDKDRQSEHWWWKSLQHFKVLGVDLGQRDAFGYAVQDCRSNYTFRNRTGKVKPSRVFGKIQTENSEEIWSAALIEQGLFRLPGEDAKQLTESGFKEEKSGKKGRMSTVEEWHKALSLCQDLEVEPSEWLGVDSRRYSFPELNDKLLIVFRRAQSKLARLQRLSWQIRDENNQQDALKEIEESEDLLNLLNQSGTSDPDIIFHELEKALNERKEKLPILLCKLANLILPLRGRKWEWVTHPSSSESHILRQTEPGTDTHRKRIMGQRGLSMGRIEQLEELRRRAQALNRALMHKAGKKPKFGRSTKGAESPDPCPEILEKLDHLKEQRVNQIAHNILALALGVRLKVPSKDKDLRKQKDIHGEYEKFREPVDFIVLEDLSRYLSSQGRSRHENSRLMKWCHRAILDKLKELAEPYGIPILETNAAYSSRFSSKSGGVGFRGVELNPSHKEKWPWKRALETASDPLALQKLQATKRREVINIQQLFHKLDQLNQGRKGSKPRTLFAPLPGGPLFFTSKGEVMQADVNAAANLVLRAVAQPNCHEILSRIRSQQKGDKLQVRRDTKREQARWQEEYEITETKEVASQDTKQSNMPNLFVDLDKVSKYDKLTIQDHEQLPVATSRGIFGSLRDKEWEIINKLNQKRINRFEDNDEGEIT